MKYETFQAGFRRRQKRFFHHVRLIAWRLRLAKAKAWKDQCLKREANDALYYGNFWVTYDELRDLLRRAAGLWPGQGANPLSEFADALKGKPGQRGCGEVMWERAVRAIEDCAD